MLIPAVLAISSSTLLLDFPLLSLASLSRLGRRQSLTEIIKAIFSDSRFGETSDSRCSSRRRGPAETDDAASPIIREFGEHHTPRRRGGVKRALIAKKSDVTDTMEEHQVPECPALLCGSFRKRPPQVASRTALDLNARIVQDP